MKDIYNLSTKILNTNNKCYQLANGYLFKISLMMLIVHQMVKEADMVRVYMPMPRETEENHKRHVMSEGVMPVI
jgi:hypothetical protein